MNTTLIASITEFATAASFAACLAMTLYLIIERTALNSASRRLVSKATVVSGLGVILFLGTLIASTNPASVIAVMGTSTPMTLSGIAPSVMAFGLFAVAIPVMLQMVTNLASYSEEANRIGARMIAASIVMITASFIATGMTAAATSSTTATIAAVVAVVSYAYIVSQMFTTLAEQSTEATNTFQQAFATCRNMFTYGVGAYIAVSALSQMGIMEVATGVGALINTLATLALFTGISFTALNAGREVSRAAINSAANDVDISVSGIATAPAGRTKKSKAA